CWVDRDWKVRLLKLKPEAEVYVYSLEPGVSEKVEYHPFDVELKEGKTVTEEVHIRLDENTDPGRYLLKVEMAPPDRGHNNPYENVEPLECKKSFRVVKYDPALWHIPYLNYQWKKERTEWMIQKPCVSVTRYDGSKSENTYWRGWWLTKRDNHRNYTDWFGSREKAENRRRELVSWIPGVVVKTGLEKSNIAPKRRTVISAVSLTGSISKPLHANQMFQKGTVGSGGPVFENAGKTPKNVKVGPEGNLTLAKKPNGKYYQGGTVVSSVMKVPRQHEDAPPTWIKGTVKADTPDGTHVKVYVRFGSSVAEVRRNREWVPAGSLEDNSREGDYGQYRAVLYTEDPSSTPTLRKVKFRALNAGQLGEFYWAQKDWSGGPGYLHPKSTSKFVNPRWIQGGYYEYRDPVFYHEGDTIMESQKGVPMTGKVKIIPKGPVFKDYYPRSSILLELKPKKPPKKVRDKTSTMEHTPPRAYFHIENVIFLPGSVKKGGKKVFRFAYKGSNVSHLPQITNIGHPSVKYSVTGKRYKKWNYFFYPDRYMGHAGYRYPKMEKWFEDATTVMNTTHWFYQKVKGGHFEDKTSLRRVYTTHSRWNAIGGHQPTRIAAWELKSWAEQKASDKPEVVMQDNAWKVDDDVEFDFRFIGMEDSENFLDRAHSIAKNTKGWVKENYNEQAEKLNKLGPMVENLTGTKIPQVSQWEIETSKGSLLSIAEMDDKMKRMILEDVKIKGKSVQSVAGQGKVLENIEYRVGGYFTVVENVGAPGIENIGREEVIWFPFDPNRKVEFPINVTGEGMTAEVTNEKGAMVEITIYCPKYAGDLKNVRVYSEGGKLVKTIRYGGALSYMSELPKMKTGGGKKGKEKYHITLMKGTDNERITLKVTNEWGATATQTLKISGRGKFVGKPLKGWLKWIILALILAGAWVALAKWIGEKRKGRKKGKRKPMHPPW
ncbi:hypothetical protein AKJ62_03910, partial [candidate division MSBL1 archaeon SCGC-AAA259D14]